MKNLTRFSKILFVCVLIIGQSAFAQPIQEQGAMTNKQPEFLSSPVHLSVPSSSRNVNINISAEVLKPESGKYNIDEDTPVNDTLPALSDMLNRDVEVRSEASFESLRRNSIFSVESTLVSRFLGFVASKQSA